MDFNKFDTKPAAEQGAVMHVQHPVMGHGLYEGEGANDQGQLIDSSKPHEKVTITVRGYHAPSVQSLIKQQASNRMEQMSQGESERLGHDMIDRLILDWANISRDGEALDCNRENKVWLTEQNHAIFNQIDTFAKDQRNFFGSASAA